MLFRLVVLIAVAVLLLPTDERKQSELYGNARYALERTVTFCDRNAALCESGREMWAVFVRKAEFGLELVTKLARGQNSDMIAQDATPPLPPVQPAALTAPAQQPPPIEMRSVPVAPAAVPHPQAREAAPPRPPQTNRNTLVPSDTHPQWRGPANQRAAM
jgi:hypothetical protein